MPVPDYVINKKAKAFKNWMIFISVFLGLAAIGAFQDESVKGVAFCAGGSILFAWIASIIKTKYKRVGGINIYQ